MKKTEYRSGWLVFSSLIIPLCVLISNKEKIHIEGYKVNIENSVGAGDCFNGALATGIKRGLSLKESIKLGNKSASISVSRKGVQESMPFFNEINTI